MEFQNQVHCMRRNGTEAPLKGWRATILARLEERAAYVRMTKDNHAHHWR
jgi:hypothetical protein